MNITATITDGTASMELPIIEVPLTIGKEDFATDVVTLSNDIYTDFVEQKSSWAFPYSTMAEAEYEELEGFYNRQFSLYQYPSITIPYYGVFDVPVRMYLNAREVFNDCGTIQNVAVNFRETAALGS